MVQKRNCNIIIPIFRVFASYFTLLYLALALLGYLLNLNVTSHMVIALMVVFFYTVVSYRSKGATS